MIQTIKKKLPQKVKDTVKRVCFWRKTGRGITDGETNGERFFLTSVLRNASGKIVVFDVGANIGLYTDMVLAELSKQHISKFEIHLFEPQASCATILRKKFSKNTSVKINLFGLSDKKQNAIIYSDEHGSSLASLYERKAVSLNKKEEVELLTLEEYAKKNGIDTITLLKIDTEGNEKKVIAGCGSLLDPKKISAIQFEYGGCYEDSRTTLSEVVEMLFKKNYCVGKILRDRVEYKNKVSDFPEDYGYCNYAGTGVKYTFI